MQPTSNTADLFQAEKTQFQTKKSISATLKIKNWITFLQDLALEDEAIIGKKKILEHKSTIVGVVFIAITVLAIYTETYSLFFLLLLPLAYVAKIESNKENLIKKDIENHFRLYALPLLRILAQESSENQKIKLSLDCNNPEQEAYKISEVNTERASYPRFMTSIFSLTWLETQLKLADDSFLQLKITDDIRKVVRIRRNPRGKIKTKTKRKISQTIAIKISFSKAHYTLQPTSTAEETPTHFTFKLKSQTTEKTINMALNFDSYNDMQPLLSLLARAYASVKSL